MQEINDDLVERFFNGRCTKEEAARVLEFLKTDAGLSHSLKIWEESNDQTPLPKGYRKEMQAIIRSATIEQEHRQTGGIWRWAIAACLTGTILFIWLWKGKDDSHPVTTGSVQDIVWLTQHNALKKETELILADSSRVILSPGADIWYRKDFNAYDKREIYMTGQVSFKVTKNKEQPFSVYCNTLSTTALGTAFRITGVKGRDSVMVKLYQGRVVVSLKESIPGNVNKEYYLLPGQELVINIKNRESFIRSFLKKKSRDKDAPGSSASPGEYGDRSYMFNNQTLAEVLDQLAMIYHVEIIYSKNDIGNVYFIGKIDSNDPFEKTINDIALLNKLSVTKEPGKYILKKKKGSIISK